MPKAPTPVAELKARRAELPRVAEFAIRMWLNSARTELTTASKKWEEGKAGVGSPFKVEEAYLANKKAAEILQLVSTHPDYAKLLAGKASPEYYTLADLRGMVIQAAQTNKEIIALLEKREADWNARPPSSSSSRPPPPSGSTHPASPPPTPHHATDSYFSQPSPPRSSSSPTPDPPAGPPSLADRLAALRSAGLESTPTRPLSLSRPPSSPPALPSSSHHPPPSPSQPRPPPSPTLAPLSLPPSSPKIPRKPSNLSRSPPGSARALDTDAEERSGSAPPVILRPRSSTSNGTSTMRGELGGRGRSPTTPPSTMGLGRSPLTPPGTMALGLGAAEEFGSHFPSVEQWESGFPQVPTLLPGMGGLSLASPARNRGPLPAPPKPKEMEASEFEKENEERARAMGKLGGYEVPTRARGSSLSNAGGAGFAIPFTNEVLPQALYAYLAQTRSAPGRGPRVLLLDVRSRNEFEQARVVGDVVCLEPVGLRQGVSSLDLEGQLTLSPPSELALFATRDQFDVIVIYDRASTSIPNAPPPSTSSDAQRALWNLTSAIYDHEFRKSLKRQPVLLKGGWEAWEREIGSKGIVREGEEPSREEVERAEAKKANRRTAVMQVGVGGPAVVRNGAASVPLGPPYPASSSSQSGYFSPPPPINYTSSYASPMGGALLSPRLAMPPTAVQRSGSNATFEPYPSSAPTSRPSYPQPHLNGFANPSCSSNGSSSSMPFLPQTRSEFGDLQSSQSYNSYANAPRTSIDYPQLRSPPPPSSSRPSYPSAPPLPLTLTRPPAIQPAPIRSNSSFALPNSYPTSLQSKFISNYTFGDDAIGLTGLKNLGNTCYMNSTIQCLSATIPFAKYFKEGGFKRDINRVNPLGTKGLLADAVSELIRAMWAQNYLFLSPVTFRDQICRFAPQFRGSDQHDAQEFLGFLLDGLHEDLNYVVQKPLPVEMTPEREHDLETLPAQVMSMREWDIYRRRNDSFVVQCFQGQFRNQMKCLTCSKTSTTYNTFMPLSIPVPSGRGISKVTLQDCISSFVREEILDKDDAWFCPRCKKARKTSKKLSLSRLPPILVIHLKRFSFHGPFSDKIETQVQYPLSGLDLTSFVPPPLFDPRAPPLTNPPKGHVYDLYGVTNHYGNLSSGHYTAYVRNHNEWNHIGDSKVSAATPQMVESNRNSYILWYRKV